MADIIYPKEKYPHRRLINIRARLNDLVRKLERRYKSPSKLKVESVIMYNYKIGEYSITSADSDKEYNLLQLKNITLSLVQTAFLTLLFYEKYGLSNIDAKTLCDMYNEKFKLLIFYKFFAILGIQVVITKKNGIQYRQLTESGRQRVEELLK